ncbi:hypothetical protein [Tahibacter amnicola]|uniref:Uncharacterized protein n=1 Tax=Tahibacter amnicola TaxID=2976241 RepID=A0ABY6BCS0_9GAMM|nr:hypothetical protein [Tahibacter amnicola]UXI66416.1 hypothetical protein N4264_16875 [Tahibacter amnicola]
MAQRKPTSRRKEEGGIGRVIFWIVTRIGLPLAILAGLFWWRVDAAVEKVFAQVRRVGQAERGRAFFNLKGEVGVGNVKVVLPLPTGPLTFSTDRVAIQTPGLMWLLRTSILGPEEAVPEMLGFSFRNLVIDGLPDAAVQESVTGTYSGTLFEADGCKSALWSRADLREMGLAIGDTTHSLTMRRVGSDGIDIEVVQATPGAGAMNGTLNLKAPGLDSNPAGIAAAAISAGALTFRDDGFIAARNAYCAKEAAIDEAGYVEQHMAAIRARLARRGLQADAPLEAGYRTYASKGGELTIRARPQQGLTIPALKGANFELFRGLMSPIVEIPGHEPLLLSIGPLTAAPVETAAAATADAPVTTAAAPAETSVAAPVAPVAPAAAPPDAAVIKMGEVFVRTVPYEDLRAAIGQEIIVRTTNGTTRRGQLVHFASSGLDIQLSAREGGYQLSIPRGTVKDVNIVTAPPASAPGTHDAKKN